MKRDVLTFSVAFLLGFFVWFAKEDKSSVREMRAEVSEMKLTSSSRQHGAVEDYENVMLTVAEKLQFEVEEANSLSALLGLVERLPFNDRYINYNLGPVAEKLAKLYPVEALRYYAERPTNFRMNEQMWGQIVQYWTARDMTACLNYLEHGQTMSMDEYCSVWEEIVKNEWAEKSAEILAHFSQMSVEKQKAILQREQLDESIMSELLPKVNDQQIRLGIDTKLVDRQESHVMGRALEEPKNDPFEMKMEEREALVKDIKYRKLAPQEIAALLRDVRSRADRHVIVSDVLQKRGSEETIDGWLARVSEVMAVVSDIPDYPPARRYKDDNSDYEALEVWLPKQSTKIQRAWADDVVNQTHGESAMEWIDTLSQASLRADLRDMHLEEWVNEYPSDAAEYIAEKATAFEKEDYLPTAVYRWALQDYAAAKQWLDAQPDSEAKAAAIKKLELGK